MLANDIKDWLLEHGFTENEKGLFTIDYGSAEVSVFVSDKTVRVHLENANQVILLATVKPNRVKMDEYGMLQGMGLNTAFQNTKNSAWPPKWWPHEYAEKHFDVLADFTSRSAGPRP